MDKIKNIEEIIKNEWTNEEIVCAWNVVHEDDMDDYVYDNDEYFFEEMFEKTDEAVRAICYGDYHYTDTYVRFNGYANLDSFDYWDEDHSPINIGEIAEWIVENGDADMPIHLDTEELENYFIYDFAEKHKVKETDVREAIEEYLDEEDFDFVTEDWNDLESLIKDRLNIK